MADGDEREFGWLYGKQGQPGQPGQPGQTGRPGQTGGSGGSGGSEPPPEATRVMPVQPREPGGPPPTSVRGTPPAPPPPPPGPPAPAPAGGGGGFWARRLRRPRFWVRTVLVLLLLWLVYTIAVPFITWSSAEQLAFEPDGDRPADQDGTTYLLVGSDSRKGLSEEERKELSTGNAQSELTDTIMLLHTGDGPNVLLSIPRDTAVDGSPNGKINGLFADGGYPALTAGVEDMTGVRVDKFVEIGLGGVADVVDAVGGIEVCPKEDIQDKLAGLDIEKGCQEVDGTTALAYSRSRKQSALGDLERVRRQREVVSAVGHKVLSPWTVINPVRWWRLNKAVPTFFRFGEGTSKLDAARWALAMTRVDGKNGLTCTVPVTDGSATQWNRDLADPLFAAIAEDRTDDITDKQCTPNGVPVNQ